MAMKSGWKQTTMTLSSKELEAIQEFDTCTIANAIEHFRVRPRNEGYTKPGLRCVTEGKSHLLGYAVTSKVRFSNPSVMGLPYLDRTDWWSAVDRLPLPRIAVIKDMDSEPGSGATAGEVHAAILKAFHFDGLITNGAVRDVPAVSRLGFAMFAPFVAVSHSYMHLVSYGEPVEILGLQIRTGDLLYAEDHGVISIPLDIAAEIPEVAARIQSKDQRIVKICLSVDFSTEKLLNAIRGGQE
jgi:4-hydroxy-4-methyl-2-oxoglutarate aldolase